MVTSRPGFITGEVLPNSEIPTTATAAIANSPTNCIIAAIYSNKIVSNSASAKVAKGS